MTALIVTPAQAQLLVDAITHERAHRERAAQLLTVLTAGHADVAGKELAGIDATTGTLLFKDAEASPEPAA